MWRYFSCDLGLILVSNGVLFSVFLLWKRCYLPDAIDALTGPHPLASLSLASVRSDIAALSLGSTALSNLVSIMEQKRCPAVTAGHHSANEPSNVLRKKANLQK